MTYKAVDPSIKQAIILESPSHSPMAEEEASVTVDPSCAPIWLQTSWEAAIRHGLDRLSADEIQAEIDAARKARHPQ